MLATFTSMLPSSIGFISNRDEREWDKQCEKDYNAAATTPRPRDSGQVRVPDESAKDDAPEDLGGKKRRERIPYETFIVVRPPPSVSNHPLNLQLQLVPPQPKERNVNGSSAVSAVSAVPTQSDRRSVDGGAPDMHSEELADPPTRSNRSDTCSIYGSSSTVTTTSMSSIASTTSTASTLGGRRMIVPLYNLSAHNVMTNTVLDAGTDAKIAKFHKRCMEVLSLASLECIEVWPRSGRAGSGSRVSVSEATGYFDQGSFNAGQPDLKQRTPTASAFVLSSTGSIPTPMALSPTSTKSALSTRLNASSPQSGARKFFGKVFKRKDSQPPVGEPASQATATSQTFKGQTFKSMILPANLNVATELGTPRTPNPFSKVAAPPSTPQFNFPPSPNPTASDASSQVGSAPHIALQPPTLGIHPMLSAPTYPPTGRPARYVWVVRRWLKGGEGGLLNSVIRGVGTVGTNLGVPNPYFMGKPAIDSVQVAELRFEWVRGVSKKRKGSPSRNDRSRMSSSHGRHLSLTHVESESSLRNAVSRRSLAMEENGWTHDSPPVRSTRYKADTATAASRVSTDSLRSAERTNAGSNDDRISTRASRTDSMTSASQPDEIANARQVVKVAEKTPLIHGDDDGEESDPEDSETPWICSLVISSIPVNRTTLWEHEHSTAGTPVASRSRPTSHAGRSAVGTETGPRTPSHSLTAHSAESNSSNIRTKSSKEGGKVSEPPGTLLRLKVGTLCPTPHHPKVVAQLKVPFPLPDVEVDRARVRRRIVTAAGLARPVLPHPNDALEQDVLMAEEIKDILSCTAFWIVVREGFGGVGKVTRKGDGWRIRG